MRSSLHRVIRPEQERRRCRPFMIHASSSRLPSSALSRRISSTMPFLVGAGEERCSSNDTPLGHCAMRMAVQTDWTWCISALRHKRSVFWIAVARRRRDKGWCVRCAISHQIRYEEDDDPIRRTRYNVRGIRGERIGRGSNSLVEKCGMSR